MSQRGLRLWHLASLAWLGFVGCATPEPAVTVHEGRPAMGTILEITLVAPDEATGKRWIAETFDRIEAIERQVSNWDPDSPIARLNRRALEGDATWRGEAQADAVRILVDAKRLAVETGSAFDVTVGPLVSLWREHARTNTYPDADALADARARVGTGRIRIGGDLVQLAAGSSVDLGGLAKGWALEQIEPWLRDKGIERALLNFGGSSLLAIGAPLDANAWRVLVGTGGRGLGVLELADAHASVSASLGQGFEIEGRRHGHVVDPRTGRTVDDEALVIAVGASGAATEAWSTALLVRGREGIADAVAAELEILLVDPSGIASSPSFPALEWVEAPDRW